MTDKNFTPLEVVAIAKPEESAELTETKDYKPTPHMLVWLDTAIRLMTDNITEISSECNIARATWYDWLKDDNFRLWFKQEWDKRLSGESWKLDTIGMKLALTTSKYEKDKYKYWEAMQKRVGNMTINKENANLTQINIGKEMGVQFEKI